MATFKNMKDLEKFMNKKIASALEREVANEARKVMKENVITEVYDAYQSSYERTGGLYQDRNIETNLVNNNTLTVRNTRNENGRDIAYIVEYGDGYSYDGLDERIGARPFHAETARELEQQGLAKDALAKGLRRQGLDVN